MVEITHNIFEEDFNKQLAHTYNLSVLVGADRLSYLIASQKQVLAIRTYKLATSPLNQNAKSPIQQLLVEDSVLREKFRSIKIGIVSNKFTLVPNSLFEEESAEIYLNTSVKIPKKHKVSFDRISALQAVNVYAYDYSSIEHLLAYFPKATFYHNTTGLLDNFISNFASDTKDVFINIYAHQLSITVLDRGQLLLHNIFEFKSSEDCLYYILLVYKQLALNTKKHAIYVAGELMKDSEIYNMLYKYIRNIHFVATPNFYNFGTKVKQLSSNFFFDLYSLKLCE
ncbi:MAG: DUF3822 family protein [Aureispira sp.]|nr:DUF3822 family protein [Aureispira sp.]